jgi:hemin uptake protein HemP
MLNEKAHGVNHHLNSQTPAVGVARIRSESLLGDRGRLVIVHGGDEYQLRQTRQGKLILTK